LPNVGPYIYDVSISGFTRSSIYIYDISSLRVNISKPFHDVMGDDNYDDDDNDDNKNGMWDIFLLGKTDYWCKIENVSCTSST